MPAWLPSTQPAVLQPLRHPGLHQLHSAAGHRPPVEYEKIYYRPLTGPTVSAPWSRSPAGAPASILACLTQPARVPVDAQLLTHGCTGRSRSTGYPDPPPDPPPAAQTGPASPLGTSSVPTSLSSADELRASINGGAHQPPRLRHQSRRNRAPHSPGAVHPPDVHTSHVHRAGELALVRLAAVRDVSPSKNPGSASTSSPALRMLTEDRSDCDGLVVEMPRSLSASRGWRSRHDRSTTTHFPSPPSFMVSRALLREAPHRASRAVLVRLVVPLTSWRHGRTVDRLRRACRCAFENSSLLFHGRWWYS